MKELAKIRNDVVGSLLRPAPLKGATRIQIREPVASPVILHLVFVTVALYSQLSGLEMSCDNSTM